MIFTDDSKHAGCSITENVYCENLTVSCFQQTAFRNEFGLQNVPGKRQNVSMKWNLDKTISLQRESGQNKNNIYDKGFGDV